MATNVKLKSASEIVKDKLKKIIGNDELHFDVTPNPISYCYEEVCPNCGEKLHSFLGFECSFSKNSIVKLTVDIKITALATLQLEDKDTTLNTKFANFFRKKDLEVFVSKHPVNIIEKCSECNSHIPGRNIKCFIFHNSTLVLEFYVNEDNF